MHLRLLLYISVLSHDTINVIIINSQTTRNGPKEHVKNVRKIELTTFHFLVNVVFSHFNNDPR